MSAPGPAAGRGGEARACDDATTADAGTADAARRAERLLRWYPRIWRDRYGEEFAELLISDIEERPHATGRTLDVIRGGAVARLSAASLVSLGCCLAVVLGFGAAMWSQLTIGWQWSAPASTASVAAFATVATSVAMSALLAIAVLAALPVLFTVGRRIARGQAAGLLTPSAVLIAATAIVFAGGRHFENGWPGTGGHGGFIPAGVAAFEWATSLSVSSYWAHPGALAAFPVAEVAWMAICPLTQAVAVTSAAIVVRRAGLPARILAFETRLAAAACTVMAALLVGCSGWVATEGQQAGGRSSLFHAGLIDVAGIAVLAVALAAALAAARTASRGLSLARS